MCFVFIHLGRKSGNIEKKKKKKKVSNISFAEDFHNDRTIELKQI